jgi:hypothetical protein
VGCWDPLRGRPPLRRAAQWWQVSGWVGRGLWRVLSRSWFDVARGPAGWQASVGGEVQGCSCMHSYGVWTVAVVVLSMSGCLTYRSTMWCWCNGA